MTGLTHFRTMWAEYPQGTSDAIKARIGGAVNAAWITNTCVVRVCRSLNYAGFDVPIRAPGFSTLEGGDGRRYGFRVAELKTYLGRQYGPPQVTHAYDGTGGAVPASIAAKKGIICFDVTGWSDATGHFDLWDGARCINHGYFERASKVHLWEVSDGDAAASAGDGSAAPAARSISASVGAGGENRPDDVRAVQTLLAARGVDPGPIDGKAGPATIAAIEAFQRRFATWPDGRVDPGGRTLRELLGL